MSLLVLLTVLFLLVPGMEPSGYWDKRRAIIERERQIAVGGDLRLNHKELEVNKIILNVKLDEYKLGRQNASKFLPSRNFIDVKHEIQASKVFKLIRKLPKGCSLHTHLFAAVSFDYVFNNLTHRENLYVCDINGHLKLKFLNQSEDGCELLAEKRKDPAYDAWLRKQLILGAGYKNINDAWSHFRKIFTATYDLFSYKPIFEEYIHRLLQEHYDDNIFYLELRGPFVELYELNGKTYNPLEFIRVFYNVVQAFSKSHPKFRGAKYIYSPYRKLDVEILRENLKLLRRLMKMYPNFIVGMDLVGFEEEAALVDYIEELKGSGLKYFFHAGETNWFGNDVDYNLLDAILLGSKRIGHAFALPKHPELFKLMKHHNIAIEISPISNQVLKLVEDLRNHPGSYFIAQGLPVVICSDDPGNWGAVGLSYDWYLAFMAMTSEGAGLEVLKKLAVNSIEYSGMSEGEKEVARMIWGEEWGAFIDDVFRNESGFEVVKTSQ